MSWAVLYFWTVFDCWVFLTQFSNIGLNFIDHQLRHPGHSEARPHWSFWRWTAVSRTSTVWLLFTRSPTSADRSWVLLCAYSDTYSGCQVLQAYIGAKRELNAELKIGNTFSVIGANDGLLYVFWFEETRSTISPNYRNESDLNFSASSRNTKKWQFSFKANSCVRPP